MWANARFHRHRRAKVPIWVAVGRGGPGPQSGTAGPLTHREPKKARPAERRGAKRTAQARGRPERSLWAGATGPAALSLLVGGAARDRRGSAPRAGRNYCTTAWKPSPTTAHRLST